MSRAGHCLWAAAVAAATACGSAAEPEPGPLVYRVRGFRIEDYTREAGAGLIDSIGAALESVAAAVTGFLPEFGDFPDTLTFELQPGGGIPVVTTDNLHIIQYADDLALEYLPHHLTHLLTGYARRAFLEDGIAVYATEALDPGSTITNPYRGQPPHAWVSLFQEANSQIAVDVMWSAFNLGYAYDGSSADASAWQLFIETGSFTRWVMETYGRAAWFYAYDLDDLAGALGVAEADLESEWLAATRTAFPAPLTCEEALGTRGPLGTREVFWCARARGE